MNQLNFAPYDGLRGVLSIYILLYNCLISSSPSLDIQGWSLLSMFYILSGFTIHYVERMRNYEEDNREVELRLLHQDAEAPPVSVNATGVKYSKSVSTASFMQTRAIRILPMYYLSILLALPLWLVGYGAVDPSRLSHMLVSFVTSVVPTVTFIAIPLQLGSCINSPAWTISTLFFFWLTFSYTHRRQALVYDSNRLVESICSIYWKYALLSLTLLFCLSQFFSFDYAFMVAFTFPRLSLFNAGVFASELVFRSENTHVLWSKSLFGILPYNSPNSVPLELDEDAWSRKADNQAAILTGVFVLVILLKAYCQYEYEYETIYSDVWLQLLMSFSMLELLVSLSKDQGRSRVSQILQSNVLKYLGKLSYCIYLLHYPIILYMMFALHGSFYAWPRTFHCGEEDQNCKEELEAYRSSHSIPLWSIPIVIIATLLLAVWTHRNIEEPIRAKYLSKASG